MKKNITINLLGRLYAIDEDAYELLKKYTDSLHNYFGQREGGDEIADDIEARIAELFDELKQQGVEAITIEHVQDIIHRVGSPEEMEGEPDSSGNQASAFSSTDRETGSSPREGNSSRRLYRNMADKKFMGVLSGLATYFGGDVLWWRLGFVALFFLSGFVYRWDLVANRLIGVHINASLILLYVVLGILMPVANTPEDRLRMKGKQVNPQNLADEVSQPQSQPSQDSHLGCIGGFFFILGTLIRWFFYFMAVTVVFSLLAAVVGLLAAMVMPHVFINEVSSEFWQFFEANQTLLLWEAAVSLIVLIIPTYCLIHGLFNEFGQLRPMGFRQRAAMLALWLVAFIVAAVIGAGLVGKVKQFDEEQTEQRRVENTHDGIYYQPHEWEFLAERGWRVVRADHCNDRYTSRGQYYTEENGRYIDTYDSRHRQLFTIERTERLQPGTYQLIACVRAEAQGAYVYAFADSLGEGKVFLTEIPADGNKGGNIWRENRERRDSIEAADTARSVYHPDIPDWDRIRDISDANSGQGYGWNRISLPEMQFSQPVTLHYGVSTDPAITQHTWLGQWFSACDFELKRIDGQGK